MDKIENFVTLLDQAKPTSFEELKSLGFNLTFLARGRFRMTYNVDDLPIIIKVPKSLSRRGRRPVRAALTHARKEIDCIEDIKNNERFYHLRRYLPKIYYYDYETGLIVMHKYHKREGFEFRLQARTISSLLRDTLWKTGPSFAKHIYWDEQNKPVVVDFGCLHCTCGK